MIEQRIKKEMQTAQEKYGHFNSSHEAYAVLKEEVDEFWVLVKHNKKGYTKKHFADMMISELIQIAAVKDSKEDDDEKHVHPLQLDVIDRIVELYSNPGEVVFTPFMGVGSEVYSPVSLGRKGIGIELKDSYFKQATMNLKEAKTRFKSLEQLTLL